MTTITLQFTKFLRFILIYSPNKPQEVSLQNISIFLLHTEKLSPRKVNFLSIVTWHRTARCDLWGSTWPSWTSLSSPISDHPSLTHWAPVTWAFPLLLKHTVTLSSHSILLGRFSSYLYVADSLPVGAQFKGHLIREASHSHPVQRDSPVPIIITSSAFATSWHLSLSDIILCIYLLVSCLLFLSSPRILAPCRAPLYLAHSCIPAPTASNYNF